MQSVANPNPWRSVLVWLLHILVGVAGFVVGGIVLTSCVLSVMRLLDQPPPAEFTLGMIMGVTGMVAGRCAVAVVDDPHERFFKRRPRNVR